MNENKKVKTRQAGPRTTHKLANQAETHFPNSNNQVITPKKALAFTESYNQQRPLLLKQGYPKEDLKPEVALKKARSRSNPSLPEPRKRGATEINLDEGNAPKKPKPKPMSGKSRVGQGRRQ